MTVSVYADGTLKHSEVATITDTGSTVLRLPSGFLARRWSVKFVGSVEIESAAMVTTLSELKNV